MHDGFLSTVQVKNTGNPFVRLRRPHGGTPSTSTSTKEVY